MTGAELADSSFGDAKAPGDRFGGLNKKRLWFPWRYNEAGDKIPYRLDGKTKGWKNASGRGTRAQAEAAHARMPGEGGVGLVLGEPTESAGAILVGVDLDTCLGASGTLAGWAEGVLRIIRTYTEVSPSDTGLKLYFWMWNDDVAWLRAEINQGNTGEPKFGKSWKYGSGKHPPAIELFTGGRWFAVTGNPLPGTWRSIDIVPRVDLMILIDKIAPRFAATGLSMEEERAGKAEAAKAAKRKPKKGSSEHAMGIGGRMKRNGVTDPDAIEQAILDDDIGAEWASRHDQRQIDRVIERAGAGAELSDMEGFGLNEDGVAEIFAATYAGSLRFDHDIGNWYLFNGTYWRLQKTKLAFDWVRRTCRKLRLKNAADPAARALAKKSFADAVEIYCQRDQKAFAVTSEIWNRDPMLLGTPGRTVDLRTGELRPARQEDNITKIAAVEPVPYDEELSCPEWRRFINQVTRGDAELARFLQQWCGYCLTGDIREEALIFVFGPGNNGKSKFLETLTGILGDYACTADMEVFAQASFARHSTELAMLHGARVVGASETDEGRGWNESRVKALTGGDSITARFMRQDNFTFRPQFKLTPIGNNRPALRNLDIAARRRFNIVPFEYVPPVVDRELPFRLKREWPEILGWMIAGCLDWQANGLIRAPVVLKATEAYFAEHDIVGRWLDACCDIGKAHATLIAELYMSFCEFTKGERPRSNLWLSGALQKRGFENTHTREGAMFGGLRIRVDNGGHDDYDDL